MLALLLLLSLTSCVEAAYVKVNAADPGASMWMAHGGCPGQKSPVGLTVPIIVADPFLILGMPTKPLAAKYVSPDGRHLLASAQEFFCNASVWSSAFKLSKFLKGTWIFQSSYAYNLCGMGYATGVWKSASAYMLTLEAMGSAGTTVFMNSQPSRYMNCAELCQGVKMPTTVSSLALFHLKYPGGSLLLKALGSQLKGKPFFISIPAENFNGKAFYAAGYAVGVVCAVIVLISVGLAIQGLIKLQNKKSFSALILAYESVAGLFRALLFLTSAPVGWGYAFYNGLGTNTLNHMQTLLGPLGIPTTFLTALVWVKFTVYRSAPPMIVDALIFVAFSGITIGLWIAALSLGFTYENTGILLAGVNAVSDEARTTSSAIKCGLSSVSIFLFVVANLAWLQKLGKAGGTSAQLASVAKKCMRIMIVQIILLCVTLAIDVSMFSWTGSSPLLDAQGKMVLPQTQLLQAFVEPFAETFLALSQVLAIRDRKSVV